MLKKISSFIVPMFFAGILSAQNLVTNPGFETGNTTGWFAFGSPMIGVVASPVHSGNFAAQVSNRTQTYMGIAQTFAGGLQTNVAYSVSVWVQLVSGSSQTMQVTMQKVDDGGTSYAVIASGSVSAGAWTQLAGSYTLNLTGTLTNLVLYVEMPSSATVAYYIDDVSITPPAAVVTNAACTLNWTNLFQRMDGFGASSAWRGSLTTAQADMFFSTNTGIGLSFLRTRIATDGSTVESSIMQQAVARGARVWSAPWSPPASIKSANFNGVVSINGGKLIGNAANYQLYANQLAGYAANVKNNYGVNLYAVSVQNEPDYETTNYESCTWTAQQFHDFIPYLSGALAASNAASVKIVFPESMSWSQNTALQSIAMNDAAVAPLVGIVANHNYDGGVAAITNWNKPLWETEVATFDAYDGSITNAVYWAGRIHNFLTVAQVSAWHFWWLISANNDNEGLTDTSGNPAKRMYALGNFSRFVRPNFYRVGLATNSGAVQISGWRDVTNSTFAIVAINSNSLVVTQAFTLANLSGSITNVTPWLTTAALSLSAQPAIGVTNGIFSYALPALSIATFVGVMTPSNTPPVFGAASNPTVNCGLTLLVTNTATDTDAPPQTLTYALLAAPASATLNSASGIFSWRPPLADANTTNAVMLKVTDNGIPPLSATNNFNVIVPPLGKPGFSSGALVNGKISLVVTGAFGPDYTLLISSNLLNWQPLFTSNSPAPPVNFSDTNLSQPARFYRVQLGP